MSKKKDSQKKASESQKKQSEAESIYDIRRKDDGRYKIKFHTLRELQTIIDNYFEECARTEVYKDDEGRPCMYKGQPIFKKAPSPPTITGLTLALDLANKETLVEYTQGKYKPFEREEINKEMATIITRARLRVTDYMESRLSDRDGVQGAKFWLACNSKGWSEKSQLEITQRVITVDIVEEDRNTCSQEDDSNTLVTDDEADC